MLNLDPAKLVVILVLALVIMGPEKMQSSARHFGALWRSVTEFREKAEQHVREALPDLDLPRIPTSPRGALAGYVSDLLTTTPAAPAGSSEAPAAAESVPGDDPPSLATRRSLPGSQVARAAVPIDDASMN
jgi:Sec-independent protein translocase protein TatA